MFWQWSTFAPSVSVQPALLPPCDVPPPPFPPVFFSQTKITYTQIASGRVCMTYMWNVYTYVCLYYHRTMVCMFVRSA